MPRREPKTDHVLLRIAALFPQATDALAQGPKESRLTCHALLCKVTHKFSTSRLAVQKEYEKAESEKIRKKQLTTVKFDSTINLPSPSSCCKIRSVIESAEPIIQ